ncbi:TetR/AcrR family transcriptional regulator [Frigoriflavimonas asaccharolytica]|uniref:HTH tetR-type domain-containing protein n=1 Tax=Frigoriflavimonas asaccharolytica TaxID=2735899 RepID=A0A8J8K8B6_9FLAO|nr:TetR/AcrR family transcriptional regulator [Frigoriflavimonas asaccharolytica]NRS91772.1 hypothetical protein [Frigoriflavimonas asaccharolytica]
MDFKLSFNINTSIYLKNPENSDLGKRIIKKSIELIADIGLESFNFKKLAQEVGTTEATVYRYFENKNKLLLFIITYYWFFIDFYLDYQTQNLNDPKLKIQKIIQILTHKLPESDGVLDYDKRLLHQIVISESSKVYLVKNVVEINKDEVFKPYKDLCKNIASIILEYNPQYKYPKSLSSTMIETAHHQEYFCHNLPKLTDFERGETQDFTSQFLEDFVFKAIN